MTCIPPCTDAVCANKQTILEYTGKLNRHVPHPPIIFHVADVANLLEVNHRSDGGENQSAAALDSASTSNEWLDR